MQMLLQDAQAGKFEVIVSEAIDRLSRDQEDIAHIYKRTRFAGVRIVTLSEGDVNELHIGLKGTMGALFLKDLADKTRRGLRGRVEAGKSGGGIHSGMTWFVGSMMKACRCAVSARSMRQKPGSSGAYSTTMRRARRRRRLPSN
jgi:DNA invertase Pin-like site-specific DNA recombinase